MELRHRFEIVSESLQGSRELEMRNTLRLKQSMLKQGKEKKKDVGVLIRTRVVGETPGWRADEHGP